MIHRIIKKFKDYKLHVKQRKTEMKGFNDAWDSAYKRPMFYVMLLVFGSVMVFLSYIVDYYGLRLSTSEFKILLILLLTIKTSSIIMNWVENRVLKPQGYSMDSKKEGKKL